MFIGFFISFLKKQPVVTDLAYSVEFSFKDSENLNTEKDYYNDLPGKLPPELLDPVEDIPPRSQPPKKLTIQVWHFTFRAHDLSLSLCDFHSQIHLFFFCRTHTQKPRDRFSSNLIDLNSPPPDPNYVNDKSFDVNSNTTPPAITRDVFDMRKRLTQCSQEAKIEINICILFRH